MDSFSSKLLQMTNKIGRLCFLNLLYIACCLPVITIGAASAALYSCIFLILEDKDGYLSLAFLTNFQKHFKQSTLIWIVLCLSAGLLTAELFYAKLLPSYFFGPASAVFILGLAYLHFISCYLFAFISQFRAKIRFIFRSCCILVARHFFLTLILAMMNAVIPVIFFLRPGFFFAFLPVILFLGFSGAAYINGRILKQIFIKEQLIDSHEKEAPDNNL